MWKSLIIQLARVNVKISGIEMKRRLSVTNLSSENNLPMLRQNASVIIKVESEEL